MTATDNEDQIAHEPRVTGSPTEIWLVYGDLDDDATHAELAASGEVTWCEAAQFPSDVRYLRADLLPNSPPSYWADGRVAYTAAIVASWPIRNREWMNTPLYDLAAVASDIAAAVAAERERCAKLCDDARNAISPYHDQDVLTAARAVCENLADSIRGVRA